MQDVSNDAKASRILICDDDDTIAAAISRIVQQLGHTIAGRVSSGEEAVRTAQETKPDLILMDIQLEGEINGIEAAERIRNQLDVPIIYVTGFSQKEMLEKAKITDPYGYLSKPIRRWELISAIETALHKHRSDMRLKESETRFRGLFTTMSLGVVYQNHKGEIISANPAAERILGLSAGEMLGLTSQSPVWKAVREDGTEFPGNEHPSMQALRHGKELTGVVMGVRNAKTGRRVWLNVHAVPCIKDGDEKPFQVYTLFEDITEKKEMADGLLRAVAELERANLQKESMLKAARSLLEQCYDFEQFAKVILDSVKQATGATGGYVAFIDRAHMKNELLFLDVGDRECLVDPSLPMPIRGLRQRAHQTGKVVYDNSFASSEWVRFLPEGHVTLDNVMITPVMLDGEAIGAIGLANKPEGFNDQDAALAAGFADTAAGGLRQVRAEKRIAEQHTFLQTVLESLTHPLYVVDADNYAVSLANSAARPYGSEDALFCFSHTHRRDAPCDSTEGLCPLAEVKRTGKPFTSEHIHYDYFGNPRYVEIHAYPLFDREGGVTQAVLYALDVTDRKVSEEKQKQLMEEMERFTYIVSHDLRAPLVNIKGFSRELRNSYETILPVLEKAPETLTRKEREDALTALREDLPESLEYINSSITRMDNLIERLLQLSRIGRMPLFFQPIDMNELTQDCLSSFAHEIQNKRATVVVDPLPEVIADRTAMEQIMSNLIGNALKYCDDKRPLEIHVSGHRFPGETFFTVRDTGVGIDEMDLSGIFRIFQRATTQDVPGEGMGLAQARALAGRHGGRMWCESRRGVGSAFTFTVSNDLASEKPVVDHRKSA
jgi:PAS domain S-box-containing protein